MTLITPTITPLSANSVRLNWTGTSGATVRVFVNGFLTYGPAPMTGTAKALTVSVPDPFFVEVHETAATEHVPSPRIPTERTPLVWWRSVPNASEYRLYIDDVLMRTVRHEASKSHHETILTSDIRVDGGSWRRMRVEAMSSRGISTTTAATMIWAPGLPTRPTSVSVTGTGGVFDVTVNT